MSIGAILSQARREAGLSVAQVSERTRVRETIIRGIERDDYSACGGDFYARGHIRSIARVVGTDPAPLIEEYDATLGAPEEITAAEALGPAMPIKAAARRRPNWTAVLALTLLAVVGFAGYRLVSDPRPTPAAATGFRPAHTHAGRAAAHAGPGAAHPQPTITRHASASPPAPAATPAVTALTPVSTAAVGPAGAAQGDNPQLASFAIANDPATPWHTNWYTTARFGNLQAGTGLLLDMGRPVTITSARIKLGRTPGATVELRVGNVPRTADLRTVARATDAGGVLRLRPAGPVRGRYLLIWFTRLPPDSSGTYQASVSGVRLKGRA